MSTCKWGALLDEVITREVNVLLQACKTLKAQRGIRDEFAEALLTVCIAFRFARLKQDKSVLSNKVALFKVAAQKATERIMFDDDKVFLKVSCDGTEYMGEGNENMIKETMDVAQLRYDKVEAMEKYFDDPKMLLTSWITAMDNFHKKGNTVTV